MGLKFGFYIKFLLNSPHNHSYGHISVPLLNAVVIQLNSFVILRIDYSVNSFISRSLTTPASICAKLAALSIAHLLSAFIIA